MESRRPQKAGIILLICLALSWPRPGGAQESSPAAGPLQWGGAVEAGYRFAEIKGEDRYREVVNLEEGLRLFDFNLWFKDPEKKGTADEVRLRLNSLGDPFPSGRLDIKKNKVYHLAADYREYRFFFNREDSPPPFSFSNTLLTDNHDFDQKRRRGGISLSLFPAGETKFNFGYSFAQRAGEARVPRIFTFVPGLTQDLDERFKEYFGAVDFPLGKWNLHLKQSYWTFENKNRIDQVLPLLRTPLVENRDELVWTYVSTLKAHARLGERWDIDVGYIYAHSEGDFRLDILRPVPIQIRPGNGGFLFDTHVFETGLSHLLREDLILHFDYRFHTFDQDGHTTTDLFLFPQRVTDTDYSLFAHTGTFQLEYLPFAQLTLKGGYRVQYRQIEAENFNANLFDGGQASADARIFSHGWIASADWKPFKFLSLFGEYEGEVFDNPYTRISPEDEHIAKFKIRYETPLKGLNLKGTFLWKRKTNPDQQFRMDIQDYIMAATYQPDSLPELIFDVSYTHERIRDKKQIINQEGLRPPVPLFSTFVFDSDARILSGGISYEGIYQGLGGRFAGTFARTKKENGQEYALGSLSFWYKNPWVIPIVTYERSYLLDFEKPNDSYAADLVTLSLRKDF